MSRASRSWKRWPGGLLSRRWLSRAAWASGVPLFFSAVGCLAQPVEMRPDEVFKAITPAVITVEVETKAKEKCVGTGFLALRQGIAVTAWHLVQDAKRVTARFSDGAVGVVGGLVDVDEAKDIALVSIDVTNRPLAEFDTNSPPVGTRAYAVGAPRGFEFSLTEGLVSQVRVLDGFRNYQVSCAISPGNSGGPVLSGRAQVLAVVAWSEKDAQNLNFATPVGYVLRLDPSRPMTKWDAIPRHPTTHRSQAANRVTQDRWPAHSADGDFHAFQQLIEESGGQTVTVVVFRDKSEKAFTFTVPKSASVGRKELEDEERNRR